MPLKFRATTDDCLAPNFAFLPLAAEGSSAKFPTDFIDFFVLPAGNKKSSPKLLLVRYWIRTYQ